jgi:hypothetical protein
LEIKDPGTFKILNQPNYKGSIPDVVFEGSTHVLPVEAKVLSSVNAIQMSTMLEATAKLHPTKTIVGLWLVLKSNKAKAQKLIEKVALPNGNTEVRVVSWQELLEFVPNESRTDSQYQWILGSINFSEQDSGNDCEGLKLTLDSLKDTFSLDSKFAASLTAISQLGTIYEESELGSLGIENPDTSIVRPDHSSNRGGRNMRKIIGYEYFGWSANYELLPKDKRPHPALAWIWVGVTSEPIDSNIDENPGGFTVTFRIRHKDLEYDHDSVVGLKGLEKFFVSKTATGSYITGPLFGSEGVSGVVGDIQADNLDDFYRSVSERISSFGLKVAEAGFGTSI